MSGRKRMRAGGVAETTGLRFLSGGGEMGALMRAFDWTSSSLGPPVLWPQSLRTIVRLMLNTGHPMYVWWGADCACLYNDAYRESIGPERHPGSLGRPAREVWDEIWDIIGPQIDQVMSGGGATWHVNQLVPITRHGRREDVYWTYSYSPIDDEAAPGGIGGVLVVCTETTQQILAARQLATERDQLAQLFEQAPIFMAMLRGPEHRIELANPGYLQLVGHRPILGRTVAEALPDAVEQGYLRLLDEVYTSGKAYAGNGARYAVQATPGGPIVERVVDFVYQPIKDGDGRVTGVFVEGADVTDRARADAELRDRNALLRLLDAIGEATRMEVDPRAIMQATTRLLAEHLGAMRCAYADVEPDHDWFTIRGEWTAPGYAAIVGGYSLAEFGALAVDKLGRGETLVIHDVDRELPSSDGADTFNALQIKAVICCPLIKADGLRGLMAVHAAAPRHWIASEIALVQAVAERSWAHLERVRANDALKLIEPRLRGLLQTIPGFIWTADATGEIDYISPRFLAFVGRDEARFKRAFWPEFIHPEDMPRVIEVWTRVNAQRTSYQIDVRFLRHDGVWRWLDIRAEPELDAEGHILGWYGYGEDQHEKKETADALAASEARFREMAGQLSDSNRLKDEFLATLAHELRNPLAPIRNALELMKLAPRDGAAEVAAREMIGRQLGQMVRLIDDLLDLSRVSRGIVELRRSRLPVATALRDAVETSRPLIEQSGHSLTVTLPGEELVLEADPTRIVQVFANLLNNAAKFTPHGGRIELRVERDEGQHVVVSVRDNGVGIPGPMLGRVFDMFTQVDRSHAHVGGGLGIGLTLVRRLVEMHGGSVEARSGGHAAGSEFLVRLPLAPVLAPETDTGEHEAAQAAPHVTAHRIIVADDNVDAVESLSMMLEFLGHETRTARDGEQALAIAREFQPDVMVLDIAMPGLSGLDLARSIRAEAWGRRVLLIASSGWGQPEDRQRSLEAGFDHHLVKPLDFQALGQLLEKGAP